MKICNHWTAGTYNPCSTDLNAYHFLIDSAGRIYKGNILPKTILTVKIINMLNIVVVEIQIV